MPQSMTRWEYLEIRGDYLWPYSPKAVDEIIDFFAVAFEEKGSSFKILENGIFSSEVGNTEIINALGFLGWEAISVDFNHPGYGANRRPPLWILLKRPMEFQEIAESE